MTIHFLVAHKAEALPLIQVFGVKPEDEALKTGSHSDNTAFQLHIIGQKAKAFPQCIARWQQRENSQDYWINFGVAGHASLPKGTLIFASSVHHGDKREHYLPWYPDNVPISQLFTVDNPETNYPNTHTLYDMEAWFIMDQLCRLNTAFAQRFCCLKLVSDNKHNPLTQQTLTQIKALPRLRQKAIENLLSPVVSAMR